jgi:hypothetical protein
MKRSLFFAMVAMFLVGLAGCASAPSKKDTVFASYSILLVKPIKYEGAAIDKISGEELVEFDNAKNDLQNLFNNNLSSSANEMKYFDQILFAGSPDARTLVLEPKLAFLDPGIRWVMPGKGVIICELSDGSTGKTIGKYTVSRSVSRPITSTMMGAIETLIGEMGEDAASQIGNAI